ncbi:GNAT family N-acetyltransferase [Kineosporia sp. NBRC 101731]|uniref:GNAT family N-acetyltransferase n=1 Tax=Kineosporia sp. NBRC 101731 TaxID=3032199 RepID=UPI0024A04439|nr:GNAT family N-acetyltransferase [Kineosporia sp. NBRC 101731]GLY27237.1 hypothetical protein Kisp02_06020 [Kineosporia sp. NBRC 101731]
MTDLLHWRPFEKSDRPALACFVCTDPESKTWDGQRKTHPRPWEHSVQSAIRSHKPRPARGEHMLLGLDGQGIAAAVAWARDTDRGRALIQLIGIATRYRGRGRSWAKEAIEVAMQVIIDEVRTGDAQHLLVRAHIDHRNAASKRLFAEAGFVHEGDHTQDLGIWVYYTEL